jgi:ketosteroid isomerase-like protein
MLDSRPEALTESLNVQAIRAHIAAFSRGDIDAICLQCTEDVIWNPPATRGIIPYNTPRIGREGVRDYCTRLMGALEWQAFDIPMVLDAPPDHVVIKGVETITVRATGKRLDNIFLTAFRMRDGLIAEFTLCENTELVAWAFEPGRA